LTEITSDFYAGGRDEMLNELNRSEVLTRLFPGISGVLKKSGETNNSDPARLPL
jgi:hypothetical protein